MERREVEPRELSRVFCQCLGNHVRKRGNALVRRVLEKAIDIGCRSGVVVPATALVPELIVS